MRMTRLIRVFIISACGAVVLGYAAVVGMLFVNQKAFVYGPTPFAASAQEVGLDGFQDVTIRTGDGETLRAWYKPPSGSGWVVLYFHGNAASLPRFTSFVGGLTGIADGVLAIDYRGFGGSTGAPSPEGLFDDALSSYRWLRQSVAAERIVVIGHSLGTGPAVRVAADEQVAALVLQAPYTSIADIASYRFPYVPVRLLLTEQIDSTQNIRRVKAPILVQHGISDPVIPYQFGKELYELAPEPKTFVRVDELGHALFLPDSIPSIHDFLEQVVKPKTVRKQAAE